MRVALVCVLVAACDGGAPPPSEPTPGPAPAPAAADTTVVAGELALLAKPPPPAGPITRLFDSVAKEVGAGVARCPLAGGGRAKVIRGRPSEQYLAWGIPIGLEDPEPAPWNPVFDGIASDAEWAVFLTEPGDTSTVVTTRQRSLRYLHPPAVAGQTVTCTGVEEALGRMVRGHVEQPRPPELSLLPCVFPPPKVGADGTFATVVPAPCTLWAEGGGQKSEKIAVDSGSTPLEVTLHTTVDPMQKDLALTPEAVVEVSAFLKASRAGDAAASAIIERAATAFAGETAVSAFLAHWRTDLRDREVLTRKAEEALLQKP